MGTYRPIVNWRLLVIASCLLIASVYVNFLMSSLIATNFADRPMVPDLLFRVTPYVPWLQYVSDLANVVGPLLLGWYVFRGHVRRLPYVILAFALAELARGFLIILTPLGGPLGNGAEYGLTSIIQNGQFPSGHMIVATLSWLLIDRKAMPMLSKILFINLAVEALALILSRGHYSIDIVGGVMVAILTYLAIVRLEEQHASIK